MSEIDQAPGRVFGSGSTVSNTLAVWQKRAPGLLLVLALAVPAKLIGQRVTLVPDVVIALLVGIVLNNLALGGRDASYRTGIRFSQTTIREIAIILFGASLSFASVLKIGANALGIIMICFIMSFSLGMLLARHFSLSSKVGTLLGAGTAICGATAVITVGPLVAATQEEITYAVTTIFSFNILAILVYPILGHAFHFSDRGFGSWAGTSVNDTSSVIATGYIFSNGAGAVATVVKLTRMLLLVPLAVGIGAFAVTRGRRQQASVWKTMPWFIFGFAGMAILNSAGLFPTSLVHSLTNVATFLIVMVLAAVGLSADLAKMRALGLKPFAVGISLAALMSLVSLAGIRILGLM